MQEFSTKVKSAVPRKHAPVGKHSKTWEGSASRNWTFHEDWKSCWDHNFFQGPVATIGVTSDTRRSYGSMLCSYHVRDEGVGGRVQQNSIQSKSIDLCVKAARAYNKNKSSGLSFESSPLTLLSSWTSGCP